METVDTLRNDLIDKLLAISNKEYLSALSQLVEKSYVNQDVIELNADQILMIQLSEKDIANGLVISQEDAYKNDLEWLKGL